jgi:Domain of unknown function (DUF4942)
MNMLATRATIEEMVAARDKAVAAYFAAFQPIRQAHDAMKEAAGLWRIACNDRIHGGAGESEEVKEFERAVRLPDPDRWRRTVVRLIDISCWHSLIQRTDMNAMMDREEREKFESSLRWVPERYQWKNGDSRELVNLDEIMGIPPFTVDNAYATLDRLASDAGMIFRRGIAKAFSSLDRRFRSHDGFKVGTRVVLTYAFNRDDGRFDAWGKTAATIRDIERTFLILDGQKPRDDYAGIIGLIDRERRGYKPVQSEHEGEFFKIRAYKNGNAHLWFTRDDLVEMVNKMLAEYYGEVLGDGMAKHDPFADRKTTPAKLYGFFPTPPEAAKALHWAADIHRYKSRPILRILEPSAGSGNLARPIVTDEINDRGHTMFNHVDCVEYQPSLANALRDEGIYGRVWDYDFLAMSPKETGLYDRVIMNPPFDLERDIDHVMHAWKFLKDDGILVAIMSAGTEFRETRKAIAFRDHLARYNGAIEELPPGSFAESGTHVNTIIVKIRKDGTRAHIRRY